MNKNNMTFEELLTYTHRIAFGLQEQIKYSQELKRKVEKLETQLVLSNEDANRLAAELELEQNRGCRCRALRMHYERIENIK